MPEGALYSAYVELVVRGYDKVERTLQRSEKQSAAAEKRAEGIGGGYERGAKRAQGAVGRLVDSLGKLNRQKATATIGERGGKETLSVVGRVSQGLQKLSGTKATATISETGSKPTLGTIGQVVRGLQKLATQKAIATIGEKGSRPTLGTIGRVAQGLAKLSGSEGIVRISERGGAQTTATLRNVEGARERASGMATLTTELRGAQPVQAGLEAIERRKDSLSGGRISLSMGLSGGQQVASELENVEGIETRIDGDTVTLTANLDGGAESTAALERLSAAASRADGDEVRLSAEVTGAASAIAELSALGGEVRNLDGETVRVGVDQSGLSGVQALSGGFSDLASRIRDLNTVAGVAKLPLMIAGIGGLVPVAVSAVGALGQLAVALGQGLAGAAAVGGGALALAASGIGAYVAAATSGVKAAMEVGEKLEGQRAATTSAKQAMDSAAQSGTDLAATEEAVAAAADGVTEAKEQQTDGVKAAKKAYTDSVRQSEEAERSLEQTAKAVDQAKVESQEQVNQKVADYEKSLDEIEAREREVDQARAGVDQAKVESQEQVNQEVTEYRDSLDSVIQEEGRLDDQRAELESATNDLTTAQEELNDAIRDEPLDRRESELDWKQAAADAADSTARRVETQKELNRLQAEGATREEILEAERALTQAEIAEERASIRLKRQADETREVRAEGPEALVAAADKVAAASEKERQARGAVAEQERAVQAAREKSRVQYDRIAAAEREGSLKIEEARARVVEMEARVDEAVAESGRKRAEIRKAEVEGARRIEEAEYRREEAERTALRAAGEVQEKRTAISEARREGAERVREAESKLAEAEAKRAEESKRSADMALVLASATKKYNEEQEELARLERQNTPAVQAFNAAVDRLKWAFGGLQIEINDRVLPVLTRFIDFGIANLPLLSAPLMLLLDNVNGVALGFLEMLGQGQNMAMLSTVLYAIAEAGGVGAGILSDLFFSLLAGVQPLIPLSLDLLYRVRDLSAALMGWTNSAQGAQALGSTFQFLYFRAGQLWQAVKNLSAGLWGFFSALSANGGADRMMSGFVGLTAQFRAFTAEGSRGRAMIESFMRAAQPVLSALWRLVRTVVVEFFGLANALVHARDGASGLSIVASALDGITAAIRPLRMLFQDTFVGLGPELGPLIANLAQLANTFAGSTPVLIRMVQYANSLMAAFNRLPEPVRNTIASVVAATAVFKALGGGAVVSLVGGLVRSVAMFKLYRAATSLAAGSTGRLTLTQRVGAAAARVFGLAQGQAAAASRGAAGAASVQAGAAARSGAASRGAAAGATALAGAQTRAGLASRTAAASMATGAVGATRMGQASRGAAAGATAMAGAAGRAGTASRGAAAGATAAGAAAGGLRGRLAAAGTAALGFLAPMGRVPGVTRAAAAGKAAVGAASVGLMGRLGGAAMALFRFLNPMNLVRGGLGILRFAFMAIGGPVGLAVAAVVAAGYAIYKNWAQIKGWGRSLIQWFNTQFPGVGTAIRNTWNRVISYADTLKNRAFYQVQRAAAHVRTWFFNNWPRIRTVVVRVFEAIVGFVQNRIIPAFQRLRGDGQATTSWFSRNWPRIREVVTTVIQAAARIIRDVAGPVFNFLKQQAGYVVDWFRTNWPLIKETASTVWSFVKTVASGAVRFVSQVVRTVFGALLQFWRNNHEQIKGILRAAWEIVKAVVSTAIKVVLGVIKTVMAIITGDWRLAWNTVKQIFWDVWEGVKKIVKNALLIVWNAILISWNEITRIASEKWEYVRSTISDKLDAAWDKVEGWADSLKTFLSDTWEGLTRGVSEAWSKIGEAIWKPIEGAVGKVSAFLVVMIDLIAKTLALFGADELAKKLRGIKVEPPKDPPPDKKPPPSAPGFQKMARGGVLDGDAVRTQGPIGGVADGKTARAVFGEAGGESYVTLERYTPESAKALQVANKTWAEKGWLRRIPGRREEHDHRAHRRMARGGLLDGARFFASGGTWDVGGSASVPWLAEANDEIERRFGVNGTTYEGHGAQANSQTSVDYLVAEGGWNTPAGGAGVAKGNSIVSYIESKFRAITDYIIWNTKANYGGGWETYKGGGGYGPPVGASGFHTDHAHWSVTPQGQDEGYGTAAGGKSWFGGIVQSIGDQVMKRIRSGAQKLLELAGFNGKGYFETGLRDILGGTVMDGAENWIRKSKPDWFTTPVSAGGEAPPPPPEIVAAIKKGFEMSGAFPASAENVAAFARLAWKESNYNPRAVQQITDVNSNMKGAGGFGDNLARGLEQNTPQTWEWVRKQLGPDLGPANPNIFDPAKSVAARARNQKLMLGHVSDQPGYSEGGLVTGPHRADVGETGKELFVPLENRSAIDATQRAVGTDVLRNEMRLMRQQFGREIRHLTERVDHQTRVLPGEFAGEYDRALGSDRARGTIQGNLGYGARASRYGGKN